MKICIIRAIISIHTQRWAEWFANRGHEVHIISPTPLSEVSYALKNVHIHRLNLESYPFIVKILPFKSEWASVLLYRKIIKELDPDIVHGQYITSAGVPTVCAGNYPKIVSAWGSDIAYDVEISKINMLKCKYVLKKVDMVHACDEPAKKRLMELGCDEKKIFIQPFGIDTTKFSPGAKSQALKEKLGIADKYSVIIARTLTNKTYHIDIFIKAIPQVLKHINNVKFIVAGSGPDESNLKQLAIELGVNESVIFLGKIPNNEMPAYFASVDLYAEADFCQKAGGGIGVAAMEAMACGAPQVISRNPSVAGSNGWFQGLSFEPGDPKDLAEKIVYLLKNEKVRQEIGEKSRKVALEIGDLEKNMKEFEQVYYNLIENRRKNKNY